MEKTKLTEFENDSIWMSYRYCIGRHTISAHQRACDICEFLKTKDVSDDELTKMAIDIRDQIDNIIKTSYDFHVTFHHESILHNPFNLFMQYCIDTNLTDINMLNDREYVYVDFDVNDNLNYTYRSNTHKAEGRCFYWSWLEDLKVWSELASWLDKRCHKDYICKDGEVVNGFESYIIRHTVENEVDIEKVMIPTDMWNGYRNIYVSFDDIVEYKKENN